MLATAGSSRNGRHHDRNSLVVVMVHVGQLNAVCIGNSVWACCHIWRRLPLHSLAMVGAEISMTTAYVKEKNLSLSKMVTITLPLGHWGTLVACVGNPAGITEQGRKVVTECLDTIMGELGAAIPPLKTDN